MDVDLTRPSMRTRRHARKGAPEELQAHKRVKTKKCLSRSAAVKQWFQAVASANEAKVSEMLIADPTLIDIEGRLFPGFTALHVAASKGLDKVVSQLLAAKPTLVDSLTDLGLTALHVAAERGHDNVIELLLAAKGSVDATDFDGRTALHCAAKATPETVEFLLALSPTLLDVCDEEGRTALIYAIKSAREDIVNQLLAANPKNLDAADMSGMTALHHAILQGNEALVWRLLEMKPDLIQSAPGPDGRTPLRMATGRRRHATSTKRTPDKMAFKLFELYPQATGVEKGRLLYHLSVWSGSDSDFELIFPISTFDQIVASFKAAPQEWDYEDRLRSLVDEQCGPLSTVLRQDVMGIVYEYLWGAPDFAISPGKERKQWFEAVETGNEKLVTQLLGEDPSLIDAIHRGEGYTALHFASHQQSGPSYDRIVAQLVAAKPSLVAQCDRNGDTALHLAASQGNASVVEILLTASPSVGLMTNLQGATPLISASMLGGQLRVAELLLAACPGALDLVDRNHYTALLHASFKQPELVGLLLSANPQNIEAADPWDNNVLHYAVSHGRVELVAKILTMQPSLAQTRTDRLQTPLWLAVDKGHNELVEKLFVLFPQAVHMADDVGMTPYHRAVQLKNTFAISLFSPKLTVDEMARGYRKHHDNSGDSVERCLRSVVDAQCADVFAQLPAAMDIVCTYLGFGTLVHTLRVHILTETTPRLMG